MTEPEVSELIVPPLPEYYEMHKGYCHVRSCAVSARADDLIFTVYTNRQVQELSRKPQSTTPRDPHAPPVGACQQHRGRGDTVGETVVVSAELSAVTMAASAGTGTDSSPSYSSSNSSSLGKVLAALGAVGSTLSRNRCGHRKILVDNGSCSTSGFAPHHQHSASSRRCILPPGGKVVILIVEVIIGTITP